MSNRLEARLSVMQQLLTARCRARMHSIKSRVPAASNCQVPVQSRLSSCCSCSAGTSVVECLPAVASAGDSLQPARLSQRSCWALARLPGPRPDGGSPAARPGTSTSYVLTEPCPGHLDLELRWPAQVLPQLPLARFLSPLLFFFPSFSSASHHHTASPLLASDCAAWALRQFPSRAALSPSIHSFVD